MLIKLTTVEEDKPCTFNGELVKELSIRKLECIILSNALKMSLDSCKQFSQMFEISDLWKKWDSIANDNKAYEDFTDNEIELKRKEAQWIIDGILILEKRPPIWTENCLGLFKQLYDGVSN